MAVPTTAGVYIVVVAVMPLQWAYLVFRGWLYAAVLAAPPLYALVLALGVGNGWEGTLAVCSWTLFCIGVVLGVARCTERLHAFFARDKWGHDIPARTRYTTCVARARLARGTSRLTRCAWTRGYRFLVVCELAAMVWSIIGSGILFVLSQVDDDAASVLFIPFLVTLGVSGGLQLALGFYVDNIVRRVGGVALCVVMICCGGAITSSSLWRLIILFVGALVAMLGIALYLENAHKRNQQRASSRGEQEAPAVPANTEAPVATGLAPVVGDTQPDAEAKGEPTPVQGAPGAVADAVRCTACQKLLRVPPNAPVFKCVCGALLSAPSANEHGTRPSSPASLAPAELVAKLEGKVEQLDSAQLSALQALVAAELARRAADSAAHS